MGDISENINKSQGEYSFLNFLLNNQREIKMNGISSFFSQKHIESIPKGLLPDITSKSTFSHVHTILNKSFFDLPTYVQSLLVCHDLTSNSLPQEGPQAHYEDTDYQELMSVTITISDRCSIEKVPRGISSNKRIIVNVCNSEIMYSKDLPGKTKTKTKTGIPSREPLERMNPFDLDLKKDYFFKSKGERLRPAKYRRFTVVVDWHGKEDPIFSRNPNQELYDYDDMLNHGESMGGKSGFTKVGERKIRNSIMDSFKLKKTIDEQQKSGGLQLPINSSNVLGETGL
jgi:hypothetical protein